MVAPSGEQYAIEAAGYRAVVTESGAALRVLEHDGRALIDGFGENEMSTGGRGQLLAPWTNRTEDGVWEFDGRSLQLPLTEPARANASHGLVRWTAWAAREHTDSMVRLTCRLMAQSGWPWTLDFSTRYALGVDGLTVHQEVVNPGDGRVPYACGAHPYLRAGDGPVDDWELTLPARTRTLVDADRKLPTGTEAVAGTEYDFTTPRRIGATVLDHAFSDLVRDADGRVTVRLTGPEGTVALWGGPETRWLQVFSADDGTDRARRCLAVEPMTAPAGALRTGEDLVVLDPGDAHTLTWGIRADE